MSENPGLSEREREILCLVATGASNKEIAQQLCISANTVKVHLRNIFSKIGATSRTEATLYALREGLATLPATAPAASDPVLTAEAATAPPAPVANSPVVAIQGEPLAALPDQSSATPIFIRPTLFQVVRNLPRRYLWLPALAVALLIALGSAVTARQTALTALASPAPSPLARWRAWSMLPTARSGLAVATYENQVYAIGGEWGDQVSAAAERYDPASDRWILLASKPTAVGDVSAAVVGGRLYVPGGRLSSGRVTSVFEVYDPRENKWETRASLPSPVSAYALTAFEGKLYLFGGWDGERVLSAVFEYDPGADTWHSRTAMPTARRFAGAAVAGGSIYVIGGEDGAQALAVNEQYLPEREDNGANPWMRRAPLPNPRAAIGMTSIADAVYVIGGEVGGEPLPPLEYQPQPDTWQPFENPVREPWSHLGLVALETRLYAIGGKLGGTATGQNLAYQAIYKVLIPVFK